MKKIDPRYEFDQALIVLARELIKQMCYDAFSTEWSRPPLHQLLPSLYGLLNLHPAQLGTKIEEAYNNTFPDAKRWNINQLAEQYPEYFGQTKQSYLDEYYVTQKVSRFGTVTPSDIKVPEETLYNVIRQTMVTLCLLKDKDGFRSLFSVIYKLYFILVPLDSTCNIAQTLEEHKEYFLDIHSQNERIKYANQLLQDWTLSDHTFRPISTNEAD